MTYKKNLKYEGNVLRDVNQFWGWDQISIFCLKMVFCKRWVRINLFHKITSSYPRQNIKHSFFFFFWGVGEEYQEGEGDWGEA